MAEHSAAAGCGCEVNEPSPAAAHGELIVSVGGTSVVATDAVLAQAEILSAVQQRSADWQLQISNIRQLNPDGPQKLTQEDSGMTLMWAWVALGRLEQSSNDLSSSLTAAAERYGATERLALRLAVLEASRIGNLVGRFPLWATLLAAGPAARGALAWRAWNSRLPENSAYALDARLLTNPAVVLLAKMLVSSLDDAGAGALGLPLSADLLLGDSGVGLIGVSTSALAVLALARRRGWFRETPVRAVPSRAPTPTMPPKGVGDLAQRIPKAVEGQPQVGIENYGTPEHPTWAVYVGGTVDWDAVATDEPWDLTANIAAMAGQNAGSFDAVVQSMHAAGIDKSDPVVIVGHSQGGLVATQVAASGVFGVRAVLTFGAPESKVPVPPGVATLTVEHTDDVVTALGGASLDDSDDRIRVRREVFVTDPVPLGEAVPAHHLDRYRETARIIDASPEENLQEFRKSETEIFGETPGEGRLWRGIRLPERPSPR